MHEVSQPVLSIIQLGVVSEPFPIQIGVRAQDPGQCFHQAHVQVSLHHGIEHHFSGIAHRLGTNMLEAGITERGKPSLKIIRLNPMNVERLSEWQSRGRKLIKLRGFTGECSA
jgi:hypothetical protein